MFVLPPKLTTHDLSTETGLQAYLAGTPFAASSVVRISGGYSCYTFRAILDAPYEDKDSGLVAHSVVIKHIRDYSASFNNIPLSIERMEVEVAALRTIPTLPFLQNNTSPKVYLARVLSQDQTNHIAIIEDFGALPSLKDYILACTSSTPDARVNATATAKEIGEILGKFLAHLHLWGYKLLHPTEADERNSDITLLEPFRNNAASTAAKRLCAWRTAGRLSEIARRYEDIKVKCDWDALAKRLESEVMEKEETFTMGDFWTGNILVKTTDSESPVLEQLVILDWELAKLGASSADIGQFAAESLLLARYATSHEPSSALLRSFIGKYEETLISETNDKGYQDAKVVVGTLFNANAIVGCTAAHTAVWGTYGPWSVDAERKEKTVKCALGVGARGARGEFEGFQADDLINLWDKE